MAAPRPGVSPEDKAREVLRLYAYMRSEAITVLKAETQHLREAVQSAAEKGLSETEIAELAGVTRMTVRAWLGKGGGARG